LKVSVEELHVVFVGDEVVSGNFPSTFTYKSTEAQKERPDLTVSTTAARMDFAAILSSFAPYPKNHEEL
jgi:hypothetical protein